MMHVGLTEGDIAQTVLLPGSPERSAAIASYFDQAEEKAYNREYRTFTGFLDGKPISVCSTGTGGPSTSIAVEELVQLGAKNLIRIGTCLATSSSVSRGDLIIPNGAVRMEGVANHYSPIEFPAVPDLDLVEILESAALTMKKQLHIGTCITRSSYYTPFDASKRPVRQTLSGLWTSYVEGGAICTDMESAVLFIVGSCLNVKTASLLVAVSDGVPTLQNLEDMPQDCETSLIETALAAVRGL